MSAAVGLFAKPPVPGRVKTRLVPPLTPEEAARLYAAFLHDTATMLHEATEGRWWGFSTDPPAQIATWPEGAPAPREWVDQRGADLGARMTAALEHLLAGDAPGALLVGSDHPTLPGEFVVRAVHALEEADVVLGPSLDGGYYLVGTTRSRPGIFAGVPWSTPDVLEHTLDRIRDEGLTLRLLPPFYDVDSVDDLRFLRTHLRALHRAGLETGRRSREALETLAPLPGDSTQPQ